MRPQAFGRSSVPLGLLVAWGQLVAVPVAAHGPAGRLVSVQGQVEVLRGIQTDAATLWLPLEAGVVIRTGTNARAAILLTDGTQLELAPNSALQLKEVSPRGPGRATWAATGRLRTILQFFLGERWLRTTGPAGALEIETSPAQAATKA